MDDSGILHPNEKPAFVNRLPGLVVRLLAIPLTLVLGAYCRVLIGDAFNVVEVVLFPLSAYVVVVLCLASRTILRRWCKNSVLLIALVLLVAILVILLLPIHGAHSGWVGVHGHFIWQTGHLH